MSETAESAVPIRPRERDALIQSMRAGVVPRIGQQHVQVGRHNEVKALVTDIERVADGGSGVRFVIGEYGSGKTFFLNLIRAIAHQNKLVTMQADLTPERRLHGSGGQARSLYTELARNISTRANPEGGAMSSLVERFVSQASQEAQQAGTAPESVIRTRLAELSEMTGGYDFADVIAKYWEGHHTGNDQLMTDAVRWLRAEFSTKTDARNALGVRTIIDDENFYDSLKLLARFVRLSGFDGLLVLLDEMVNLYKLANTQARNSNYEQILRILNDSNQGIAVGLGVVFAGTPDFLMDTRRGLFSYEALQSRLAENSFLRDGVVDYTHPVIRLSSLTPEDFYVLLTKLRHIWASGDPANYLIPDEAITAYMEHVAGRIGDAYFRTPRTTIKGFLDLLAVLDQNPDLKWQDLLETVELEKEVNPDLEPIEEVTTPESPANTDPSPNPVHPATDPASDTPDDELENFKL